MTHTMTNSDPLYYYGHMSHEEPQSIGPDQMFVDRFNNPMLLQQQEMQSAPLAVFHQLPPTGFFPVIGSNASDSPSLTHSSPTHPQPQFTTQQMFHHDSFGEPPIHMSQPSGMTEHHDGVEYQSDGLFPNISTDLGMEKRRPPPIHINEIYPTPDEPYFPHTAVGISNEFSHYTTHERIGPFSQPTSPLQSPSQSHIQQQQQQSQVHPQVIPPAPAQHPFNEAQNAFQEPFGAPSTRFAFTNRLMSTSKLPKTVNAKSRTKSVPNIGGTHTTQPGPIPASRPTLSYDQSSGEEVLTFSYSKQKIITTFTIKCPPTRVDPKELPVEFLKDNCVYPRAMVPVEEYKGNRGRYERECNEIGWTLAWSNPEIRNHRGLVQRAVDSWRNTRTDKTMRSRRVRKTEVKKPVTRE